LGANARTDSASPDHLEQVHDANYTPSEALNWLQAGQRVRDMEVTA
jgi:hypothetical protein